MAAGTALSRWRDRPAERVLGWCFVKAWVIVLLAVLAGIIGAWVGYWVGHALGWTTDAEWPLRIGGGNRAIVLSIGLAFLAAVDTAAMLIARPMLRERRLLATGRRSRARIVRVWRTGLRTRSDAGASRTQLGFDLLVEPDDRPAFAARATSLVNSGDVDAFEPGVLVDVQFDPESPTLVALAVPAGLAVRLSEGRADAGRHPRAIVP